MDDLSKLASPGAVDKLLELLLKGVGPSIEELGLIGGDLLREIRWNNLRRILARMHKKLEDGGKEPKTIPPRLLVPILESASVEDDETLQEMWAGLLASASQDTDKLSPSFVETLKQLTPDEVKYLDNFYRSRVKEAPHPRFPNLKINPRTFWEVRATDEGPNMNRTNAETFERLGLMRRDYELGRGERRGEQEVGYYFELTRYALSFMRACIGEFHIESRNTAAENMRREAASLKRDMDRAKANKPH